MFARLRASLRLRVIALALCALLPSCDLGAIPFVCSSDAQCVGGMCEPEGYCSFPDATCESQRRFGLHAPAALSEQCVARCIEQIALGDAHGCLRRSDGSVMCWGDNSRGQLGPNAVVGTIAGPTLVPGLPPLTHIAVGGAHSCGVDAVGGLHCWGDGGDGQVTGPFESAAGPIEVTTLGPITALSLGKRHSCAGSDGGVYCWGKNEVGQVGVPAAGSASNAPMLVGAVGASELEAGGNSTCARSSDGAMFCWGDNSCGKLGIDSLTPLTEPARATGLEIIVGDFALGEEHGCGFDGNLVKCWGAWDGTPCDPSELREEPEIGDNPSGIYSRALLTVTAGRAHSCLIDDADGDTLCWGTNDCGPGGSCGQLGESATGATDTAIVVPLDVVAVDLATGGDSSCALGGDGRLWCWGDNDSGQLGLPVDQAPPPGTATDAVSRAVVCNPH